MEDLTRFIYNLHLKCEAYFPIHFQCMWLNIGIVPIKYMYLKVWHACIAKKKFVIFLCLETLEERKL